MSQMLADFSLGLSRIYKSQEWDIEGYFTIGALPSKTKESVTLAISLLSHRELSSTYCAHPRVIDWQAKGVAYCNVECEHGSAPSQEALNKVVAIIKRYVALQKSVFVYSFAGTGRAALIAACYSGAENSPQKFSSKQQKTLEDFAFTEPAYTSECVPMAITKTLFISPSPLPKDLEHLKGYQKVIGLANAHFLYGDIEHSPAVPEEFTYKDIAHELFPCDASQLPKDDCISRVIDVIKGHILRNEKVLLYSHGDKGKSAALVAILYLRSEAMSLASAIQLVEGKYESVIISDEDKSRLGRIHYVI